MAIQLEDRTTDLDRIIGTLEELRRFTGSPSEFWAAFLQGATRLAEAQCGLLMISDPGENTWQHAGMWPAQAPAVLKGAETREKIHTVARASVDRGYAWEALGSRGKSGVLLGIRLKFQEEERAGVAVFLLETFSRKRVDHVLVRLNLVADIPAFYQLGRLARQAQSDVVQFADALDLMVLVNAEKKFIAAAMTFCNELAAGFHCDRVSLGWLKGDYVRVRAISHMERFEKKMDAVQKLEGIMEEAFDQDEELLWPRPKESTFVSREHESFAREMGSDNIVSLPIRLEDTPVAVLTCERSKASFQENEVRALRVACDQAARRLGDLEKRDRWFGARMVAAAREGLGKLIGVEHTFAKLLGILLCAAMAFLLFGKLPYRVEALFLLKTDDVAHIPAPFEGYIDKVHVKVGDRVVESTPLLSLDTSELLLEESTAIANQHRYSRESEKARAENALADIKIAQSLEAQARAQLALVRHHLKNADILAPFDGIVVEGDLEELLGAPVQKGDVLFKVSKLANLYSELKVDERDVHEISTSNTGEISFISRPEEKFPIVVLRIDPVAMVEEEGNVFLVRAEFPGDVALWWRPDMSGVAKIDVGKRNVLWIVTHRTIDFLRIFLWWQYAESGTNIQ